MSGASSRQPATSGTWARTCARSRRAITAAAAWSAWGAATPSPSAAPPRSSSGCSTSHERAAARAREHGEPAGQIAARELEIKRIQGALRRADELTDDVAAALEAVA
jgi:hypothetical protein